MFPDEVRATKLTLSRGWNLTFGPAVKKTTTALFTSFSLSLEIDCYYLTINLNWFLQEYRKIGKSNYSVCNEI